MRTSGGIFSILVTPREMRGLSHDGLGQLWLFGGEGYHSTSTTGNGYLNDTWRYLPYKNDVRKFEGNYSLGERRALVIHRAALAALLNSA